MKKVVLKLDLHDENIKQKAMAAVSSLLGIDSINIDMKDNKLTVVGDADPVKIVRKLRTICHTEIKTVEELKKHHSKKVDPVAYNPRRTTYNYAQKPTLSGSGPITYCAEGDLVRVYKEAYYKEGDLVRFYKEAHYKGDLVRVYKEAYYKERDRVRVYKEGSVPTTKKSTLSGSGPTKHIIYK